MPSPTAPQQPSGNSQPPVPVISLPKGGGAIHGIGEKFSTTPMTGTGSLTVPIPASDTRSDFGPKLSLSYDTGSGNGVFGVGWSLSLPAITRKTDKGLPRYRDGEESDVFILSGSEDLVPVLRDDETIERVRRGDFDIQFYRPRIEGLFSRIEKWTHARSGETHWRSFTRDNVLSIYGGSAASRISDPDRPSHVFEWLISASSDAKGNAILYEYVAEDRRGLDPASAAERCRTPPTNKYLKRVLYGNRTPLQASASHDSARWMFELVFDFGDEDYRPGRDPDREEYAHLGDAPRSWPVRRDPFSTYRATFDVRTYRLCRRTLMFHHFPEELGGSRCLVQSMDFSYDEKPVGSFLTSITKSGYVRRSGATYLKKNLPPLDLHYTPSALEDESPPPYEIQVADPRNLPEGIDGARYRWIDLEGNGISGVLSQQDSGWYYSRNLGRGRFGAAELVPRRPNATLAAPLRQFLDVDGDGRPDLVDLANGSAGFYEKNDEGWSNFHPFQSLPVLDWSDPRLRFMDVTGDGISDILITEDDAFLWHPSIESRGFGPGIKVPFPEDEEKGPRVLFSDPAQSIFLADMSGDGLADIVRIRNGEVCYWPNLGYGCFGAKILMGSPWFEEPDVFDASRIILADTDGSGPADIVYAGDERIGIYLNESGNSLSAPRLLRGLPSGATNAMAVVDLLGRGTACLVWSSRYPDDAQRPLSYVDLMRGVKPHLLTRIVNNLGAETVLEYASSTEFYLADRVAGHPWATSLPFPVHLLSRVETTDSISRNRFVSKTTYHHGYYDGIEREFRGFGRIDQTDTEEFIAEGAAENEAPAWRVPPVLTKTWFHTGVFFGAARVSRHLAHEYYREPNEDEPIELPDTVLPPHLDADEVREACRALKGTMLRQEVYALDGSDASHRAYTASEANASVRLIQRRGPNRHCVFFSHARENIALNYERRLYDVDRSPRADPRTSHSVTLDVDAYGNVLSSAAISYGRRFPDRSGLLSPDDHAKQSTVLGTLTENRYTNVVSSEQAYRTPALAKSRGYELLEFRPRGRVLRFEELRELMASARDQAGRHGPARRLFQSSLYLFQSDNLSGLLPLGTIESLGLPGESYSLALTAPVIAEVFGSKIPDAAEALASAGGYRDVLSDGRLWIPSGRVFYSPEDGAPESQLEEARSHFFLPLRFRDAFGNVSHIRYDSHKLVAVETRDPLDNVVRAQLDYRVLQPWKVTDPNGNQAEVAFDALGRVAGTAVMGKPGENAGDSLAGFIADLPEHVLLEHLRHPLANPDAVLGNATSRLIYNVFAFVRTQAEAHPQPTATYTVARETHVPNLASGEHTHVQQVFSYSDGFGREIQSKAQAEPGPDGPRWIGSGWTIFNNKGNAVRRYEPFFSKTHRFEFAVIAGVSATTIYDPPGRAVAVLNPDGSFQKTVSDPWSVAAWDANDTVLLNPAADPDIGRFVAAIPNKEYLPTWYEQRQNGDLGPVEQEAAWKTATHANTPSLVFLDPLGRTFLAVAHNRFRMHETTVEEFYPTRSELDIQGNTLRVTDALGRVVATYVYDAAKVKILEKIADSGERLTVPDIAGKPILGFDSRGHRVRYTYDGLRRPTALFVGMGASPEQLAERTEYGESLPHAEDRNLRGKTHRQFDAAGVATHDSYDYKGNLLRSTRQFLSDYRDPVDWGSPPALEDQTFSSETVFDALNRPIALTAPDRTVIRPSYNRTNLLDRVEVRLGAAGEFAPFVTNITYNAKGQRDSIEYANGAHTANTYDRLTLRLRHVTTTRHDGDAQLQDLSYTYDPSGNVSFVKDAAQQTIYFDNQVIPASRNYVYDAIYRLVTAEGREHAGDPRHPQTGFTDIPRIHLRLPADAQAMRNYREQYGYDAVGNILELLHSAGPAGSWRREYVYGGIDANNRLTRTAVGEDQSSYEYDAGGNITRMTHLPSMTWDFKNQLASTRAQVADNGDGETTYYVYSSAGQRARKVIAGQNGVRRAERLYLGGFEIYREYAGDGSSVAMARTTVHVMDDKRRVALVETRGTETTVRYQFDDHLGSSCLELDDEGAVLSYEEYYPYGSSSFQAGKSVAEVSLKRYRFTGKERDDETGFYYQGARYYAPWLGRWTSADPAGLVDGPNLYSYAGDNPARMVDPTGTQGEDRLACNNDANDPHNYSTFEEFRDGALGPWTAESLRAAWQEAHPQIAAPPLGGTSDQPPADQIANQPWMPPLNREDLEEHVPLLSFFIPVPMQYVRPYQPAPEGAPVGLNAIRMLNGQPGVGVANFSRDIAPGTSVASLTMHAVGITTSVVGAMMPMAANASKVASVAPMVTVTEKSEQMMTLYRFADVTDMQTLLPRGATAGEDVAAEVMSHMNDPAWLAARAEQHAQGWVTHSPFVSLGSDPALLAATTDPQLSTIATGLPGAPGYARAPFVLTFEVPASRIFTPVNALSVSETEKLFLGSDLLKFLASAKPNPYGI